MVTVASGDRADDAAHQLVEYGLYALPVVTDAGVMLGIITADDAFDRLLPDSVAKATPHLQLGHRQYEGASVPVGAGMTWCNQEVTDDQCRGRPMPTNDNPPHRPAGKRPPLIPRPTRLYRGVLGKTVPPLAQRIRRRLPTITLPQLRLFAFLAVLGPGIITASADNDAGGITTYSIAGAQFGYGLLWLLLLTTFSLGITQEMGARMGIVTGKGLAALIREKFGIRWTGFAMLALLIANFGSTAADIAGVGAAMEIFGVSKYVSVPIAVAFLFLLVFKGSFRWVERIFLVSAALYVAYIISGFQAHPDWGAALHNTVVPSFELRRDYIIAFIATIGTTITPWGQFFIQSYCVDKQLRAEDLNLERGDVYFGTFVTNFIAFFKVQELIVGPRVAVGALRGEPRLELRPRVRRGTVDPEVVEAVLDRVGHGHADDVAQRSWMLVPSAFWRQTMSPAQFARDHRREVVSQ